MSAAIRCDRDVDADTWVDARHTATRVRPPMLELAGRLRDRGVAVALLSNNSMLMAERWPDIVPGLFPLFEGRFFCSARLQAAKPSPATYMRCLQALAMPPAATLFVDDSEVNVAGARKAGLVAHRFTDLPQLRRTLVTYGLA
ncbi:HAD-IA family hydrolase [Frateuria sp. GZRe12]|uniref:HAD-IA family hydrolase n=1 Tax=Frateuria sp. GZRe12 TaxID=3351533 RepID=UPI003EDBB877